MEVTTARPTNEAAQLVAASLQNVRFKERRLRDAESDVRSDAIYYSPVIRIDRETSTAIIQYRDRITGEVQHQYPNPPKEGAYKYLPDVGGKVTLTPDTTGAKVDKAPAPLEKAQKAPVEHVDENV